MNNEKTQESWKLKGWNFTVIDGCSKKKDIAVVNMKINSSVC